MPFHMPRLGDRYSPLYFLSALGAGGLMVTFFMYLMFWTAHPGQPVPTFETLMAAYQSGSMLLRGTIAVAAVGIVYFAVLHVRLLIWNIGQYSAFRKTEAYAALRKSNAETQLLAIPLTLAMAVNGGFIVGLVFVPGLWSVVEYLFPLAILAFLAIGVYAFALLSGFFGRVLTNGGFDCAKNNSFAQMLPAFALSMVGVGLAAPAAMSQTLWIASLSLILSTFFMVAATVLGGVALFLGFRSMMEQGASSEAAPTLWVAIPIVTVLSIAFMRQDHGLHVHFDSHGTPADMFVFLTKMLMIQLLFGLLGLLVLRRQGYFPRFVSGTEKSAGSYALVCPGVALSVMAQFYINKGLVGAGILDKFTIAYWAVSAIALLLQVITIGLVMKLNAKHFGEDRSEGAALPAE